MPQSLAFQSTDFVDKSVKNLPAFDVKISPTEPFNLFA